MTGLQAISNFATQNFVTRVEKYFSAGNGYYDWNSLRYFFYEYEARLAEKNNIDRFCTWSMFTKSEKDKVSVEHILPQTPTKFYWRNMFRQFKDSEIRMLSGALGNLLPLSQSVNSALQNDSFEDKKHSRTTGRRGYENGSHSEIEVSRLHDWTAFEIYSRTEKLLSFMQERWKLQFDENQMEKLLGISFVKDGREIPEELEERITAALSAAGEPLGPSGDSSETRFEIRKRYWTYALVQIHEAHGNRGSFRNVNPSTDNYINGFFGIGSFYLCCVANSDSARAEVVFARAGKSENKAAFDALCQHKSDIESELGRKLQWNRGDDIKSSKVFIQLDNVSIENDDDWPRMAEFHAVWSKKFYDVIVSYIRLWKENIS